jgi:hypothetical protein
MKEKGILINYADFDDGKEVTLFFDWHPQSEMRLEYKDFPHNLFAEIRIERPMIHHYKCIAYWYKYRFFGRWRSYTGKKEVILFSRGGGSLKSLIRATNVYFNRDDDVEGGVHNSSWGDF